MRVLSDFEKISRIKEEAQSEVSKKEVSKRAVEGIVKIKSSSLNFICQRSPPLWLYTPDGGVLVHLFLVIFYKNVFLNKFLTPHA